jgi:hypothetical protein
MQGAFYAATYDWEVLHKPKADRATPAFKAGYRTATERMASSVEGMRQVLRADLHDGDLRDLVARWVVAGSGFVRAVGHVNAAVLAGDPERHRIAERELSRARIRIAQLSPPPDIEVIE